MKDIFIRAVKTFFQGFLGALTVTLPATATTDLTNESIIISLLIGGVAAGLSAVMNLILSLLNEKEEK